MYKYLAVALFLVLPLSAFANPVRILNTTPTMSGGVATSSVNFPSCSTGYVLELSAYARQGTGEFNFSSGGFWTDDAHANFTMPPREGIGSDTTPYSYASLTTSLSGTQNVYFTGDNASGLSAVVWAGCVKSASSGGGGTIDLTALIEQIADSTSQSNTFNGFLLFFISMGFVVLFFKKR